MKKDLNEDIRSEIHNDMTDLDLAAVLLTRVQKTYLDAFWNIAGDTIPRTSISRCSLPMKLGRCISEIKLVNSVLKDMHQKLGNFQ